MVVVCERKIGEREGRMWIWEGCLKSGTLGLGGGEDIEEKNGGALMGDGADMNGSFGMRGTRVGTGWIW